MGEEGSCDKCKKLCYRANFVILLVALVCISIIIQSTLSKPVVVIEPYGLLFNLLFIMFVFPLCYMTFNAFTVYAKEKRMCQMPICSYIFLSLVVFAVLCIEADMLYVHR